MLACYLDLLSTLTTLQINTAYGLAQVTYSHPFTTNPPTMAVSLTGLSTDVVSGTLLVTDGNQFYQYEFAMNTAGAPVGGRPRFGQAWYLPSINSGVSLANSTIQGQAGSADILINGNFCLDVLTGATPSTFTPGAPSTCF